MSMFTNNRKKPSKTKKSTRQLQVKRIEKLCREYVLLRDNDTCQRCGKKGPGLHASHIIAKGRGLRWKLDVKNIKALCLFCHRWWHENPLDAMDWLTEAKPDIVTYLYERKIEIQNLGRVSDIELDELENWLKVQIFDLRNQG